MKRIAFVFCIVLLITSCSNRNSTGSDSIPIMFRPDWTNVDIESIPVKFGQVLKLKNDSIPMNAIVIDFNEDEGGIWIGLCFIYNKRLFGRQITNGLSDSGCLDLLDLAYIQRKELHDFTVLETLELDKSKIGIGAIAPVANLSELKQYFQYGIEKRKKKRTPCDEGLTDLNPVRERYFEIEKIKVK